LSNICVVGTGYVGLTTGVCFADLGNSVTCIEINPEKLAHLRSGKAPIYEPGLEELQERNMRAGRLRFTDDYASALTDARLIFITVGTPMGPDGAADLGYVKSAARSIGLHLHSEAIIIDKSTVPVGTGDMVFNIISEHAAAGVNFSVVSNPEFLREGSALSDFFKPDRIVLGSTDRSAAEEVAELHAPLGAPVIITDLRTAEMIKYASNAFLATRISFINEIAQICERLGADVREVARGMGADRRIGPYFLDAGLGYGGSCFPKDVLALHHMAATAGCHPQLLQAVMEINQSARDRFADKVRILLGDLRWGLAFKPNTDDMREAPSRVIIAELVSRGATICAYDPVAMIEARRVINEPISYAEGPMQALSGADALVIATEWKEFRSPDFEEMAKHLKAKRVFDGRNMFEPAVVKQAGLIYEGIGRK